MRSLKQSRLVNEFKLYVISGDPVPLDLMVRMWEAGLIIDVVEDSILADLEGTTNDLRTEQF